MNRIAVFAVVFCVSVVLASVLIVCNPFQITADQTTSSTTNQTLHGFQNAADGGTIQLTSLYDAKLRAVKVEHTSSNGESHDHFGVENYPMNLYPPYAWLSLTYLGNPQNEPWDLKFEGYLINYTADTGVQEAYLGWVGTNYNASYDVMPNPFPGSLAVPPQSVEAHLNETEGNKLQIKVPNTISFSNKNSGLGLWSNGAPNDITVTLQRVGWVTVNEGKITTIANPDRDTVLLEIHLQKGKDGFSYGTPPS
jgi:hypothetical protein